MSSPIADLSYRNYDGPIEAPRHRWLAIAKMGIRLAFEKKSFWWLMLIGGWYYIAMIFTLVIVQQLAPTAATAPGQPSPVDAFVAGINWKDQFIHGFGFGQLGMLFIVLMLGAGAIANDNRANALLVYLSKPCTKADYMLGKWFGIALPLFLFMFVPATVFYLYGALSFRDHGFLKDLLLYPKVGLVCAIVATFQACLILGISSLFNQGRNAGATYAGLYFLSNFFTLLMTIAYFETARGRHGDREGLPLITKLFYASIDGVGNGLCKAILGSPSTAAFNAPSRVSPVPAPPLWMPLGAIVLICGLGVLVAWKRVRAVEVVG